ncbi:hypothetical protein B296_00011618 [Ensete ventricosum]|uniref:Uncharacterized protein n=1 Tax=Ensete ventricosum TaxID=4639 RepID=A0A427AR69_ENSVE|nr:hypothetical protein B296_00011618 [Ensete ventricosum]
MAGEGGVAEATTNSNTEPLLPINALYTCSLSYFNNELRRFRSYLRWICIDQSDVMHTMVSRSIFVLVGVFVPTTSYFVLSYAPTRDTYDEKVV